MTNKLCYIQGPHDADYIQLFLGYGFKKAKTIAEADVVCFTGGADVNPALYKEKPLSGIRWDAARDEYDVQAYRTAGNKFKVGICRGGQFLNVMNGGTLWQDVDKHCGTHTLIDVKTKASVMVSSTHHQQMRPAKRSLIVAQASICTRKVAANDSWTYSKKNDTDAANMRDLEVVWYRRSKSLCFQPHPEFPAHGACRDYFYSLMDRFYKNFS